MIVIAKLKARKGEEENMESTWKEMLPAVEKKDGVLIFNLHRSQKDPGAFVFYGQFKDELATEGHSEAEELKGLESIVKEFLDGPMEMDIYDEVVGIPIKS